MHLGLLFNESFGRIPAIKVLHPIDKIKLKIFMINDTPIFIKVLPDLTMPFFMILKTEFFCLMSNLSNLSLGLIVSFFWKVLLVHHAYTFHCKSLFGTNYGKLIMAVLVIKSLEIRAPYQWMQSHSHRCFFKL